MSAAIETPDADHRDLEDLSEDRWSHVAVPDGWEPVAEVCRAVRRDLAHSVSDTVDAIRSEVPTYRDSMVPRDDLVRSVERNLDMLLLGVAERRGPTPEEIEVRSALGHRRAHQGFPVDALLQAFHVGYRDLWRRFLQYADDPDVSHLLLTAGSTLWEWTHRVTDGIGRAHADTTQVLALRAASARHRFLELLLAGDVDSEEVRTLTRSLRFDASGTFRGSVIRDAASDGALVPRFQAELGLLRGTHQVIPHGRRLIVVSQNDDLVGLEKAARRLFPAAIVGVGLTRNGLAGARLSVGDAERAADVLSRPGVESFDSTWLWAILKRDAERLDGFLEEGRRVARENPPLAETVEAFAAADFSVSAAARELHIHPNTATYRLERWLELTGWDPRTFDGLARSLAAIRIVR